MRKHRLVLALGLSLTGGNALAQTDCRTIGAVIHCLNPPPATPMTSEEKRALQDRIIAEERAVLAPLASGPSPAACDAALGKAEAVHRYDLVSIIKRQCGRR